MGLRRAFLRELHENHLTLFPAQKRINYDVRYMRETKRMRIAWLGGYPLGLLQPQLVIERSSQGHPASWIVNLAKALSTNDDVDLQIITAGAGIRENQTIMKNGITFHVLRHTFPFTIRGFPEYMPLDVLTRYASLRRQIRKVILKLQPDLIHVHGTEYGYGLAALDIKIPTIVSIQGIVNLIDGVSPSIFFRLQEPIETHVIRSAKYFGSRTAWANNFVRNLNNTAVVYDLPEAVDQVFFKKLAQQSTQNILIVGSVLPRKGIEEALDAMRLILAKCPSAKLLVAGDGKPAYFKSLKQRTKFAGIESHVEWLGFKTAEEIVALHAVSALLIHPCLIDNSPNSVAEAMASGLPVIASNVGGIPSMIENGVTGLLVEARNHHQLAEAVIDLLHNETARRRLASRAKEVAFERHLPSKVAEKTLSVYQDIILNEKRGQTCIF
jgi:glycosyltransferase involved in cell wall biosynthesis